MLYEQSNGEKHYFKCPCEIAKIIEKESPATYSFQSLTRSSATSAADNRGSSLAINVFFGWCRTLARVCHEYVSSSKVSTKNIALKIQGSSDSSDEGDLNLPTVITTE